MPVLGCIAVACFVGRCFFCLEAALCCDPTSIEVHPSSEKQSVDAKQFGKDPVPPMLVAITSDVLSHRRVARTCTHIHTLGDFPY